MSFSETIFLFALALLVFGPKKLPEIGRQIGKILNEFRKASNEFKAQIEAEISHLDVRSEAPAPRFTSLNSRPELAGVTEPRSPKTEAPAAVAEVEVKEEASPPPTPEWDSIPKAPDA
jgi:TatA/E family protein of Tat protein translocase